ncbi:MAG: LLM class flavin-dependent oxidoreductase [Acidimicrobiia bacterium]
MRFALSVPPFDELADAALLADMAHDAERAGWDGFFLWDHILRREGVRPIADPWIALAAIAMRTSTLRIGPMITPIVRRRPQKLARECITLDHLSGGRLVLGSGLGVDTGRELSAFDEITDERERAAVLDEGLDLLCALWSGDEVVHYGRYFTADHVAYLPTPVQRPRVPIWLAARQGKLTPARRAARFDGLVPIETDPDGVARQLAVIRELRGTLDGFDVALMGEPGEDPEPFRAVGGTWWMVSVDSTVSAIRGVIAAGPPT